MKRPTPNSVLLFALGAVFLSVPFLVFADDSFIPLTSLPGLDKIVGDPTLPGFINNLYRFCIGAAALFAFVQIVWAGFLFMNNSDSISANKKAKDKIMNAIIGLVLVLSPFVVFSVINPDILDLNLDFGSLKSNNGTGGDTTFGAFDTSGTTRVVSVDSTLSRADAEAACTKQGGTTTYQCKSGAGNPYDTPKDQVCKAGEQNISTCAKPITDSGSCTTTGNTTVIAPVGDNEYQAEGYVQVKDACCPGMTSGNKCWQLPK